MKTSFTHILVLLFLVLTGTEATDEPSSACCPDGFVTLAGRCFFIATDAYYGPGRPRGWSYARELCNALMADSDTWKTDLASLDVDLLPVFTTYIVDKLPAMNYYTYWVGAQKVDGVWQWLDGSPISNMSYIWHNSFPNTNVENIRGLLVPAGGYNRFYLQAYPDSAVSPSYLCEAKKTTV